MSDIPPGTWRLEPTPGPAVRDPYAPPAKRAREAVGKVAMEVCCGSARLSEALLAEGFQVKPVDWHGNRHATKMPLVRLDLCDKQDQAKLWRLLADDKVVYVHCAPPCGTFSQARDIPIVAAGAKRPTGAAGGAE